MTTLDLEAEIVRHHLVIQDWLAGNVPEETSRLASFRDAHTDDFILIDPLGAGWDLETVARGVRDAYGTQPGLAISIDRVQLIERTEGLTVAAYRETHVSSQSGSARIATAVFESRRGRLRWRYLHETWESRT